jgi:proteasome accessory factor A
MSETTTLLKVGSADLVLRMIEAGFPMRDMTLENPIRAIREISQDISGHKLVRLANGRELSALDIQAEYLMRVSDFVDRYGYHNPVTDQILDLWERVLKAIDSEDHSLVEREIDWVIKYKLLDRYRTMRQLTWSDPRIAQLDLAYHDIRRDRGLFYLLEKQGAVSRVVSDLDIFQAKSVPPQTTRAKLRGDFVAKAQEQHRDFTVDWVHLKLNDNTQRTVSCKDPFRAVDERVDRLLESM